MVTRVYLIRHGKTIGGDDRRYKGQIDVPISEEGIQQIQLLTEHIKEKIAQSYPSNWNDTMDAVYCSDLDRALKSAEIIARPFGLKPVIKQQLRERHFGNWESLTFDEIRNKFPNEFNDWVNDPVRFSPPGGESTEEVRKRVMPIFYDLVKQHPNQQIAIVAHGGVNRVILCGLLQIPLQYIFRVEQHLAGMNVIDFHEGISVVKVINFTVNGRR